MSGFQNTWLIFANLDVALTEVMIAGDTKEAVKYARTRLKSGEVVRWMATAHFHSEFDGIIFVTDDKIHFCWVGKIYVKFKSFEIDQVDKPIQRYDRQAVTRSGEEWPSKDRLDTVRFAFGKLEITLKNDAFALFEALPFGSGLAAVQVLRSNPKYHDAESEDDFNEFESLVRDLALSRSRKAGLTHSSQIASRLDAMEASRRSAFEDSCVQNNHGNPRLGAQLQMQDGNLVISRRLARDSYTTIEATRESVVIPGSPAYRAGLYPGDSLVAINGSPLTELEVVKELVSAMNFGDEVHLEIIRDGIRYSIVVDL